MKDRAGYMLKLSIASLVTQVQDFTLRQEVFRTRIAKVARPLRAVRPFATPESD
jgi:hypothetical protein